MYSPDKNRTKTTRNAKSARRPVQTAHPLRFEPLESRRLLACDAHLDLQGNLTVDGTAGADVIEVWYDVDGGQVVSVAVDCSNAPATEYFDPDDVTGAIVILGNGGNDTIRVDDSVTADVIIAGGDGDDQLQGGSGDDRIQGGNGRDVLNGQGGDDQLEGGADNDRLLGGPGADIFDGGAGTDTADYTARITDLSIDLDNVADDGNAGEGDNVRTNVENIWGGRGNDYLGGSKAGNQLKGNYGNDTIRGGGGNDNIYGDHGNDRLYGDDGNDRLFGGSGDDYLRGGEGSDYLLGQAGADRLYGDAGSDRLWGGTGNDYLHGGSGTDSLFGEQDDDTLSARDGEADVVDGGAGNDAALVDALLDDLVNVP